MITGVATVAICAAAAALWLDRRLALALVGLAVLAGFLGGHITLYGAGALALFAALAWSYGRLTEDDPRRWWLWGALLAFGAALFLREVPGFGGWVPLGPVEIGDGAAYEKYLSLDKPLAGILLLALALPPAPRGWPDRTILKRGSVWIVATPIVVLGIAWAAGAIRWDPTLVAVFWAWAVFNLLTTCVAEEAYFRGLLQGGLVRAASRIGWPAWTGIAAAALLFGIGHVAGGAALVALSAVAGLGYGLAYAATGRIEAAILAHFAVNALHFLAFTYPYPGG